MPTKKKIIAASIIVLLLLILKWIAPFLPDIIMHARNTSFSIVLSIFLLILAIGLFRLIRILVRE